MADPKKKVVKIERSSVQRKQYTYRKGEVTLDFSLRIDTTHELEAFKELLSAARTEVSEDLERIKKELS